MADERNHSTYESVLLFVILVFKVLLAYLEALVKLVTPSKRKSIRGQNVLITGSGHGLGREMALKFAHEGANLVLVDINQANNEKVKQEVLKKHQSLKVYSYSVDIRDEAKVAALAKQIHLDLGQDIDILVNNAGIVQCLPFMDLSPGLIERTFQVNCLAHFWTVKHFLPNMIKNKRGHIVAISSIAGLIGGKYLTDYCASKFAVVGMMDSLEREIHDQGANQDIHLTTICPSCISTGMFQTFTTRFSWLLPVLNARDVADRIVDAVLKNKTFVALPPITLMFHRISNAIPAKVNELVQAYLDYGVKPHQKVR